MAIVNSHFTEKRDLPSPARTSNEAIVNAARALLDAEGPDAVTMQRVAAAVGVRAPSLYKRVRDHGELMHLVANEVATDLADTLDRAASTGSPATDLHSLAEAFRAWTQRSPYGYALLTSPVPDAWRPDQALSVRMSAAVLRSTEAMVGSDNALDAARTFVAFVHGFVSLELAGTFRLGGDPSTAYRFGVGTLVDAIAGS